ncbi:MAG: DUF3500 domain-containing protein [Planctomycetaceae bacterium]
MADSISTAARPAVVTIPKSAGARRVAAGAIVVASLGAILWAQGGNERLSGETMTRAADVFLKSLPAEQKTKATFAYDDAERINWHFIPRPRKGLPLKEMRPKSLAAAQQLISTGLSSAGYDQTMNVMSLEEVLYLLEAGDRAERRERRDPEKYFVSIFGEPSLKGTWGWRIEGHHLSLNYSIRDGEIVATTPEFFGANPGKVLAGPNRTLRVLAPEEDIARQILKMSTEDQKAKLLVDRKAPGDIRGGGAPQPDVTAPAGIALSEMSSDQQQLVGELLQEYLKNMPSEIEKRRTAKIDAAGREKIYFGWWGGSEVDQPHAYRVQGPTFLIEYNNTQNDANHVHSVWRDLAGDFNVPLKK